MALAELREGRPARKADIPENRARDWKNLQLITSKPVIYVCNVEEDSAESGNSLSAKVAEKAAAENAEAVVISARIEEELAQLDDAERLEYLETLGLTEPGLNRLIRQGYGLLDLITYFTAGPKESRAGRLSAALPRRKRPVSFIRILNAASSKPKPSPMPITPN